MKDAKTNTSNQVALEVEMKGRSNKRLMAYVNARSNLSKKKKNATSK